MIEEIKNKNKEYYAELFLEIKAPVIFYKKGKSDKYNGFVLPFDMLNLYPFYESEIISYNGDSLSLYNRIYTFFSSNKNIFLDRSYSNIFNSIEIYLPLKSKLNQEGLNNFISKIENEYQCSLSQELLYTKQILKEETFGYAIFEIKRHFIFFSEDNRKKLRVNSKPKANIYSLKPSSSDFNILNYVSKNRIKKSLKEDVSVDDFISLFNFLSQTLFEKYYGRKLTLFECKEYNNTINKIYNRFRSMLVKEFGFSKKYITLNQVMIILDNITTQENQRYENN